MTDTQRRPQISAVKKQLRTKQIFFLALTLLLLLCLSQPGTAPASASPDTRTDNPDTNTPFAPSAVCPASIGFGETIQCSIEAEGEVDSYSFSANAGDKVLVRMSNSNTTLSPGIKIYSTDGSTKLCEASNGVTAEIASCSLAGTGTYSIRAYDSFTGTQTGEYYLFLQRLNNPGSTTAISFGQTLAGSITTPAEMDTYTFSANAGDKVLVRMSNSNTTLSPAIRVYSPGGTKLCEASSGVTAEIATCSLADTGTYSILAYDGFTGKQLGEYYLFLQRLNNPGNPPTPITFGQTLDDIITTPAEMDTYTFSASAGDKVLVRMSNLNTTLSPAIRVYSPGGTKLCEASSGSTAAIASCLLSESGLYSILAYDGFNGKQLGEYYLFLQRLNNPGSPTAISFGQTRSGSISTPAQTDTYTFSALAGDKLLVRMQNSSSTLAPAIKIYNSDGTKICEASSGYTTEIDYCQLTNTGTHTILANDGFDGRQTGGYFLYLQRLNNPGYATSIGFGGILSGSIITDEEVDTFIFSAAAGDKLFLRLNRSSGSLWPGISIYAPDAALLKEEVDFTTVEISGYILTSTGTYTVLVYDGFDRTFTGNYSLFLSNLDHTNFLPLTRK